MNKEQIKDKELEVRRITIRVTEELHCDLKICCVKSNVTMQDFIVSAIRDSLAIKKQPS